MTDLFTRFDGGQVIGLVAVGGGILCGIIAIISGVWRDVRKAEFSAALKQEMLTRGMSAEDIRTVMDAGTKRSRKSECSERPAHA